MNYRIEASHLTLDYVPEACELTVTLQGTDISWSWSNKPFLVLTDKTTLILTDGDCESSVHDTGVSKGVRAVYKNLRDAEGKLYPYVVSTEVSVNPDTGMVKAEARVTEDGMGEIAALAYPPRMSFDVPEGEGYTVLPVLVYNEYMSESAVNPYMASALSVIIVSCSLLVLMFQKLVIDKRNYQMSSLRPPKETQLRGFKRFLVSLPVYIVVFLAFLPQIVVVCQSFVERSFSGVVKGINFNNYRFISGRLATNIKNTYLFSIIAIVFIIVVGILVSYILVRKKGKVATIIDTLIMFPYVIPGSVLGIGLIIAFNRKPVVLVGTAAIMIISYVIRKLPYTVRSGTAFLYQMDPFVEEASINLGVSPLKTFFTVTARMMLPGVMSGAVISWITCINELSSSIMLYSGKTSTIAIAIYQEVTHMNDGPASALATILTVTTIISLLVVFRATKGKVKIV